MKGEISYDLIMENDMKFVEGTFRVGSGQWQVFIISKRPVDQVTIQSTKWSSGATGVHFEVPQEYCLNKQISKQLLTNWLGVEAWVEVGGPDSIQLR